MGLPSGKIGLVNLPRWSRSRTLNEGESGLSSWKPPKKMTIGVEPEQMSTTRRRREDVARPYERSDWD